MSTLELSGGHVLGPAYQVRRADLLLDVEAGEIVEIGALEGTGDRRLDCGGALVMPGLVNAHCHVAMTLLRGYADDKPLTAWLEEDIWPAEAALEPADVRAGAELGVLEMLKAGTTAFVDMYFHVSEIADVVRRAGCRARLGHGVVTTNGSRQAAHDDATESLAIAERFDGAADGRIRTAFMPHSLTTVDEWVLEEYVPRARAQGIPIHYHANETRSDVEQCRTDRDVAPLAYANELGVLEPQDFLAHGVHLEEAEIDLLAESETGVVHCPASNMKLASGMAPIQRLLEAGVTVGLGTDGAASNNDLDMFGEMRAAALLGKLAAGDAGAVAAPETLRMATEGSAATAGLPVGRVEVGGIADLAVVDFETPHLTPTHDFVSQLVYAARGSDVRHTICGGSVVMEDRTVRSLDEERVRRRAETAADSLIARAEE